MKGIQIFLIRVSLVAIVAGCILCTLFLYGYSYEEFTAALFALAGQQDKLEKFRTLLLTRERFLLLRVISLIVPVLAFAGVFFLWKKVPQAASLFNLLWLYWKRQLHTFSNLWQNLPLAVKLASLSLFLLILLSRLFFVLRFPFHVDERFSYLYFVHKGFAVSLAYYPGPNNHIFYTLLCNLFDLFIDDPVWVMKLPAFLTGLVLSATFWLLMIRYFAYPVAITATALFSFAEPVFYYSMQGRGYVLLMWFVLIATHNAIKISRMPGYSFWAFFWFWLSCTLGFYTIPIFLYPFVSLLIFIGSQLLIQRKYALIKPLMVASVAVAGSVGILYLPVILFNGWAALSGNTWVAPTLWPDYIALWPTHILELASGLWGIFPGGEWFTAGAVFFCLACLFSGKRAVIHKQWMQLYLLNLGIVVGMAFLQRLLLPVRVLYYLSMYHYSILAYAGSNLIKLLCQIVGFEKQKSVRQQALQWVVPASISLVFASVNIYQFYSLTAPGQFSIYQSFDATAQWLFQRQANHIFVNDYDYSLCIRFQYETNGRQVQMDVQQPTAGKEYAYLIICSGKPIPEPLHLHNYRQIYQDTEAKIYVFIQKKETI